MTIVYNNIVEKFGTNLHVLKQSKKLLKESEFVSNETKEKAAKAYQDIKASNDGLL